jgi:hypothetical protein
MLLTELNTRQRQTLIDVFERPTRSDIDWRRIEALLAALGAVITEGRGSGLRGVQANFHRPHPQREAKTWAVEPARDLREAAGFSP